MRGAGLYGAYLAVFSMSDTFLLRWLGENVGWVAAPFVGPAILLHATNVAGIALFVVVTAWLAVCWWRMFRNTDGGEVWLGLALLSWLSCGLVSLALYAT